MAAKPCITPIVPNVDLMKVYGVPFSDLDKYKRFVEKLNYLNVTHLDIAIGVSVVIQFIFVSTIKHMEALRKNSMLL